VTKPQIPLAGVIGDPISHSKSPKLHAHWLGQYGLPGHYVPLRVRDCDLERALKTLPKLGFVGVNVTIPHKESVLAFMTKISPTAQKIGAINTVTFGEDGAIYGDNTDAQGFIRNLVHSVPNFVFEGKTAMVLGAGGAARAVTVGLLDRGVTRSILSNWTLSRAQDMANAL